MWLDFVMREIHMRKNIQPLLLVVLLLLLIGCTTHTTTSPYPNPPIVTVSSIPASALPTLSPIGKSSKTATPTPTFSPPTTEYWQGYLAELENRDVSNHSDEELFDMLMRQWLEKFRIGLVPADAISDYRIDEITIIQRPKKEFKVIAWINFSVQPVAHSGDWASITVRLSDPGDPWSHVGGHFGIYQDGDSLKLKFLPSWGT